MEVWEVWTFTDRYDHERGCFVNTQRRVAETNLRSMVRDALVEAFDNNPDSEIKLRKVERGQGGS